MVEKETIYNFAILGVIAICIIAVIYIFVFKPASDKTQDENNFEENRAIFLSRYCINLGYTSYTIQDIGNLYNAYCYTESSPMVRVVSYMRYDYTVKDGSYTFWALQEKR